MSEPETAGEDLDAVATDLIHDLLIQKGLYSSIEVESELGQQVVHILRNDLKIGFDSYCSTCKRETVFRITPKQLSSNGMGSRYHGSASPPNIIAVNAVCQRGFCTISYVLKVTQKKVQKIGQVPSMADLAFGQLKLFDKALNEQDRAELGRALGLFAHDTALGAFVYLRRVFERIIYRAHDRKSGEKLSLSKFTALPMNKKIAELRNELAALVVKNSELFSVLSLGIHELDEDKCMEIFPVVKAVLFQMLAQEEQQRQAALAEAETETALRRIVSAAQIL